MGYENAASVRAKAEYAVSSRLGGIMFWSLESEDSRNICGEGYYPLLRAANEIINVVIISISIHFNYRKNANF